MQVAAAIIALAAAVLNFLAVLLTQPGNRLVSAALLCGLEIPLVIGVAERSALSYRNRRYVRKENAELEKEVLSGSAINFAQRYPGVSLHDVPSIKLQKRCNR